MATSPLLDRSGRIATAAFALGLATTGAGCERAPAQSPAVAAGPSAPGGGFLAPPTPALAERAPDGAVRLQGRAPAGAKVRFASPQGEQLQADARADGAWSVAFAPATEPRLYALSAQAGERTLRGEGALALLPPASAATALLLRSGTVAWTSPSGATGLRPRLASMDLDAGGGFAASGSARPGATVKLMLDGVQAGEGLADAQGRFGVLAVAAPAVMGSHTLSVSTTDGADARVRCPLSRCAGAARFPRG